MKWQVASRLRERVTFDWIGGAKLSVVRGMTGATGNVYCGLHEFEDMSFLLHVLRTRDLFLDIGANIGSYTVLASKVCGARSVSVEPDRSTLRALLENIRLNGIEDLVQIEACAIGGQNGEIKFSLGMDTTNKVVEGTSEVPFQIVQMRTLDDIVKDQRPTFIKMDVEGYELEVLKGGTRTLENPSLLGLELETLDPEARQILGDYGFKIYRYMPHQRDLVAGASGTASNSLFVRDPTTVLDRVRSAPARLYRGFTY